MKFSLSKLLADSHTSVEEETISRWRRAALKQESNALPVEVDDDEEVVRLIREDDKPEWPSLQEDLAKPAIPASKVIGLPTAREEAPPMKVARIQVAQPSVPAMGIEEDLKLRFGGALRAALGPGTVIQGKLTFESPVRIDGKLTGEVYSTSTLVVGEQGTLRANIEVGTLVVYGQVFGAVNAKDLIEVKRGGKLLGDIHAGRFVIEEGGYFDGDCSIAGKVAENS